MYPIYYNSLKKGQSKTSFQNIFLEICNDHRKQGTALAFAFILYDFENVHLLKVLKDEDYWQSLHTLSGKYLTVFSFHRKQKYSAGSPRRQTNSNGRGMSYMVAFDYEADPAVEANKLFATYFEGSGDLSYPSVVFFQVHDYKVLDYVLIRLEEGTIEESFLELKGYIKEAVNALAKVSRDNSDNVQEIFDLVEGNVKSRRKIKVIKKRVKQILSVKEILGLFSA